MLTAVICVEGEGEGEGEGPTAAATATTDAPKVLGGLTATRKALSNGSAKQRPHGAYVWSAMATTTTAAPAVWAADEPACGASVDEGA